MMSNYTQGQDSALNTKMVPTVDTKLRNRKEVHLVVGMDILNLSHHNQLTISTQWSMPIYQDLDDPPLEQIGFSL